MDFSLTTLFVAPVGQTALPSSGSTQDLTAGQLGFYKFLQGTDDGYVLATSGNVAAAPYFYVAQGRDNTYLQGSKRSDKIKFGVNVTEFYKVAGSPTASVQITDIDGWSVKPGEDVTVTLRAHSSYIDTLHFNGFTRSVTVAATCLACGGDPCADIDVDTLIDAIIAKFAEAKVGAGGINADNKTFLDFFDLERVGTGLTAKLRIHGKPLTKYGVPCDVAAEPHEYDRMWFRAFAIKGADTTADFLVDDACEVIATAANIQEAGYATGTSEEIAQLEKNFYSYQAGYLKHLYRTAGYNQNFESNVTAGTNYDTYYIKFTDFDVNKQTWGDYVPVDSMIIIAVESGGALQTAIEAVLNAASATTVAADNTVYTTTTTTTV
jgi:hypothetical protein